MSSCHDPTWPTGSPQNGDARFVKIPVRWMESFENPIPKTHTCSTTYTSCCSVKQPEHCRRQYFSLGVVIVDIIPMQVRGRSSERLDFLPFFPPDLFEREGKGEREGRKRYFEVFPTSETKKKRRRRRKSGCDQNLALFSAYT